MKKVKLYTVFTYKNLMVESTIFDGKPELLGISVS